MFHIYKDSACEMKDPEVIRRYLLGGKGVVTLASPTGKYRTYGFRYPRNKNTFDGGTMFIYAQVSSGKWIYVGMLTPDRDFRLTFNSHYDSDHEISKGALYLVKIMNGVIKDTPMSVYHCGVCSVCGRKLTTPKSILEGIGPKCKKKCRC